MPTNDAAIVESLWVKRAHRGVLDAHPTVELIEGAGVEESADRGGKRQVTVLSAEAWEAACREIGRELDPVLRRANVLVRGMDFEATRGRTLELGEARIEIWGETVPCKLMEETAPGLLKALLPHWRGGAFGVVTRGGTVRIGDAVHWV